MTTLKRDGDCPRCERPLDHHYDRQRRYVGCEWAKQRKATLFDRLEEQIRRVTSRGRVSRIAAVRH